MEWSGYAWQKVRSVRDFVDILALRPRRQLVYDRIATTLLGKGKGMINKAILVGRLGKDPEVRYTPDGMMVTTLYHGDG